MDIFEHEDFRLLFYREQLLIPAEGPVASLSIQNSKHRRPRLEISNLELQMLIVILNDDLTQIKVAMNKS